MENYERDIVWLLERNPGASQDEQEAFAEKVAKLWSEWLDEEHVRDIAYAQLYATTRPCDDYQ